MRVAFTVYGTPVPQGSKRNVGNGIMLEDNKALKPWRDSVIWEARKARGTTAPIDAPVAVRIRFYFTRPRSAKRQYPSVKPDLDKLCRAIFDALTQAGVIVDDSRIVRVEADKEYTYDSSPRCLVEVAVFQ